MTWSYRKRISIAPGVRLNVSKKGISTSFGVRGASITTGRNGTYLNTGIPGTGIYNRQKIGSPSLPQKPLNATDSQKAKAQGNGCAIGLAVVIALFVFVNVTAGLIALCAWVVIMSIVMLVDISGNKEKLDPQYILRTELESARKSLEQANNPLVNAILNNYIACLGLTNEATDIEAIIAALKGKTFSSSKLKYKEQLAKYETQLADLREQLAQVQMDVDKDLSEDEKEAYSMLCEKFDKIMSSQKSWIIVSSQRNTELKSAAGTSIDRKAVTLYTGVFDFIKSDFDIPIFATPDAAMYYLYPRFIIKASSATSFEVYPIKDVKIDYSQTRFIESETVPTDSIVLDHTHRYVNKYGGPDRRFANNPLYPVVAYGEVSIDVFGLTYQFSNNEAAADFVASYKAFPKGDYSYDRLGNRPVMDDPEKITQPYFDTVTAAADKIIGLYNSLKGDAVFQDAMDGYGKFEITINGSQDNAAFDRIRVLFMMDVTKCYLELGHPIDLDTKEGFGLLYFAARIMGLEAMPFEGLHLVNSELRDSFEGILNQLKIGIESNVTPDSRFIVSDILGKYDTDTQKKFIVMLYRFASVIAKADGSVSGKEAKWLSELLALGGNSTSDENTPIPIPYLDPMFSDVAQFVVSNQQGSTSAVQRRFSIGYNRAGRLMDQLETAGIIGTAFGSKAREVLITDLSDLDKLLLSVQLADGTGGIPDYEPTKPVTRETPRQQHQPRVVKTSDPYKELHSLIGLDLVKNEISTLSNFIKIQQARQSKGLKASSPSYHCVFTGNPGTGKTTVARIVAEIYKDLGILKKGHLVETDRSGLIAEYVGQTAVKTNKIIDSALDGVLFIDEAYSLVGGGGSDYGKEAIATLLKRMEDDRERLVVILAGYTDEMKEFIDSNPGLQSRFNRYIEFPDYSADELYRIFESNISKFDYTMSDGTGDILKAYFETAVTNRDRNFGNARFVRNFFEKTLERQANRLSCETDLTTEKLSEVCMEDIRIS